MERKVDRWDCLLAVGLSLLTIVSRLPYRARMLYNWDAVQFALALREYDVVKHQPHPPGYVLYVGFGRLLHAWLDDPAAVYVVLAVLFSGLTTFVVYFLGRTMYDRPTALVATTLLLGSPLFWFYGSVGLSYAGEALFASTVAYFCYRAFHGGRTDVWLASGYLGLAGGMRQSILVLLFPLWLLAVAGGSRRLRVVAVGAGIVAAAVLTWFVPMIWLTGGLGRYLEASRDLADTVVRPTSIAAGAFEVTLRMSRYLLESVLVGLGPLALAAVLVPWYVGRFGWTAREWFLLAWIVPPVLVYTLVHFGQAGYVLTFLPAVVIFLAQVVLAALRALRALADRPLWRGAAATLLVTAVMLVNGAFFVSARPLPRDFDTPKRAWQRTMQNDAYDWIWSRTAAALREHEEVVRTFVGTIRGLYDPRETAIITELGNPRSYPWLRHAMFYLPEYSIYELQVGDMPAGYYAPRQSSAMTRFPDSEVHLAPATKRLVWFVDHWSPTSERPAGLDEIEIPYGRFLYALTLAGPSLEYAGYTLVRDDAPPEPEKRRPVGARASR